MKKKKNFILLQQYDNVKKYPDIFYIVGRLLLL